MKAVKYAVTLLGMIVAALWFAGQAAADGAVVYCGFGDTGSACVGALFDTGHLQPGVEVRTPAYGHELGPIITPGGQTMIEGTVQGADNGQVDFDDLATRGPVEIYGVSEGSGPAIELGARTGAHVNLYGAPQVGGGAFQTDAAQAPVINDLLPQIGGVDPNQVPQAGSDVWCNEGDLWCNAVSDQYDVVQDVNKANDTLFLDGHWVQPVGSESITCVDKFGVEVHSTPDENPYTNNICQPGPMSGQ